MVDRKVWMIMTRPDGTNERFLDLLSAKARAGLDVICNPLIKIQAVPGQPFLLPGEAAVFTSSNGVQFAPDGAGRRAFCVGQSTTVAAQVAGWNANCVGENADALVAALAKTPPDVECVHFSGVHVRGDIVLRLNQLGLSARRQVVYDQQLCPLAPRALDVLQSGARVIVPLFSPRTAAYFAAQCPKIHNLHVVCLSDAVSDALGDMVVVGRTISEAPEARSLAVALEKIVRRASLG